MNELAQGLPFSFLYNGAPFLSCVLSRHTQPTPTGEETVLRLPQGLRVTHTVTRYPAHGAVTWVNRFENTGDGPTGVISELRDCDVTLPMPHREKTQAQAFRPAPETLTQIFAPRGSDLCPYEFDHYKKETYGFDTPNVLTTGRSRRFSPKGGRSSYGTAPFFNVHENGAGYFFAPGWTGQWQARFTREEDGINITAGIEDLRFTLAPGETLRTCSAALLPYTADLETSFALWRRFLRELSPVGKPGRAAAPAFSAMLWGGMDSKTMLERVHTIQQNDIPIDTVWIDAGWYGQSPLPSPDEFEGDWSEHTGDWRVNPYLHPDGLNDVAKAVHAAGKKLLLWVEPERVRVSAPAVKEHAAYFYKPVNETDKDRLLNLGDKAARQDCYLTLCGLIERFGLDWYRQDFNTDPLPVWRHNDPPGQSGITELRHINGLYRLWDALLERYPHLMIDNCASGGRRIDFETLRRSVPLWRSDMQCVENCPSEVSQLHSLTYSAWLPYSATGAGDGCEAYRIRSCYGAGLGVRYAYSQKRPFVDDAAALHAFKQYGEEYLRVRPYFFEDVYALTEPSANTDVWSAQQLHRPADGSGVLLLFRRENCPCPTACFTLRGLDAAASYIFTDSDTGETAVFTGEELARSGYPAAIPEKRGSRVVFYEKE